MTVQRVLQRYGEYAKKTKKIVDIPDNYLVYYAVKPFRFPELDNKKLNLRFGQKFGVRGTRRDDKPVRVIRVQDDPELYHVDNDAFWQVFTNHLCFHQFKDDTDAQAHLQKLKARKRTLQEEKKQAIPFNILDARTGPLAKTRPLDVPENKRPYVKAFKAFSKQFRAANKAITADKNLKDALWAYKGPDYENINTVLRHDTGTNDHGQLITKHSLLRKHPDFTIEEVVQHLDAAFEHFHLNKPVTVARVLLAGPRLLDTLKVGNTITDKGYVSTSMSREATMEYTESIESESISPTILHIALPAGARAIPMSTENWPPPARGNNTQECELLLPRNQQYRVVSEEQQETYLGKLRVINLELVQQEQ